MRLNLRSAAGWWAAIGGLTLCTLAVPPVRQQFFAPNPAELLTDAVWAGWGDPLPQRNARVPLRWRDMYAHAERDLLRLSPPSGAAVAGAAPYWSYVWPRDVAFAAAALARTGHCNRAWAAVDFLARVQRPDGSFAARYELDEQPVRDGRHDQSDGPGWALWALDQLKTCGQDQTPARRLLLDRSFRQVLGQTKGGRALPPPSSDYWEVPASSLTLGTVAPMLVGLQAAARIHERQGNPVLARQAEESGDALAEVIFRIFAPGGFQRFRGYGGQDAAITWLMPPFTPVMPGVRQAWASYQQRARQPGGGLAPGVGWFDGGNSWTPHVGLVAYTAAATGEVAVAAAWLDWLNAHRTSWGSLPEKVRADGRPAGPAPLAWTAALVILTLAELPPANPA